MNFSEIVLGSIFLIICSITDLKEKAIYRSICVAFLVGFIILEIFICKKGIETILIGMVPGILIFFLSIFTKEAIGKGDAWIFLTLGIIIGFINSVVLLITSLSLVVIFSVPIIIKHKNLKLKLPFSPFILTSFIILAAI